MAQFREGRLQNYPEVVYDGVPRRLGGWAHVYEWQALRVDGHRYFVCEALIHQPVALEKIGQQVLVRFRHMYIREINLTKRTTLPFVFPVREVADALLPMS